MDVHGEDGRSVVRVLWRSTNGGRTWAKCDVLARSPLSGGVSHEPDGWWDDGMGNLYRNAPPPCDREQFGRHIPESGQ